MTENHPQFDGAAPKTRVLKIRRVEIFNEEKKDPRAMSAISTEPREPGLVQSKD